MNVFCLPHAEHDSVQRWVESLAIDNVRHFGPEDAASAAWRGRPFVVAGTRDDLDAWFESQVASAIEILRGCSYFWILSGNGKYSHPLLPVDRITVLSWHSEDQHIVRDALRILGEFPRLAGLSRDMHLLREEILRLAPGLKGPSTPVLILGESGSGKEEVAHSLVERSSRAHSPGLHCISGAWLNLEPGLALSELAGIEGDVVPGVRSRPGLLELYSDGALLIDDFDTAPRNVQEMLLRITSTPKRQSAKYRRIGDTKDRETHVWLLFATNAGIEKMLEEGQLRADFLYRFEDRVLVIPPLRDRPADLPAIANSIWELRFASELAGDRVLSWRSVREIASQNLQWDGNVRELAALLQLVVSMAKMPRHRQHSTGALIGQVLARGTSYKHWFIRVVKSGFFTSGSRPPLPDGVSEILSLDSGPLSAEGLSPCETEVKALLGGAWAEFDSLSRQRAPRDHARVRRNFSLYLLRAVKSGSVTVADAEKLGRVKNAQARKHLAWLAERSMFLSRPKRALSNTRLAYSPGRYLLERQSDKTENGS